MDRGPATILGHLQPFFVERIDAASSLLKFLDVKQHNELLSTVIHAAGVIQDRLEAALAPTGLSLAKLGALKHLAEANEPLPLGQLAERIACVKSNVTQLVDRLEAEQLVRRVPDPSDRRSVRAEITAEGRARYEAGVQAVRSAENDLLGEMPTTDRESLQRLLANLASAPLT
jgi:DNA-binding MarR family transcriptional regulator